jgi:hypothetical protein
MIRTLSPVFAALLLVAACERQGAKPTTAPVAPVITPEAAPPPPSASPGVGPALPGAGPASFVGRWAADTAWCADTTGPRQPITLSITRFQGDEHSCAITTLNQVRDGFEAGLACQAGGATSDERVRLSVQGDVLRLTWLNRNEAVVLLKRCPAPPEATGAAPPP